MVEKQKKDFTIMNKLGFFLTLILLAFINSNCNDNTNQDGDCFIPPAAVNLVINTDLPSYFHLKNLGSYEYFEAGNKGVVVIHDFDDNFYAFERTCPYESFRDCAKVEIYEETARLRCGTMQDTGFQVCCTSEFMYSGLLLQGPSRCNLRPYRVRIQGATLLVNN